MANLTRWKRQLKSSLLVNSAFSETLGPAMIEDSCRQAGHVWRDSFWSPSLTVMTFLLQVFDGAKTLRAAVALLLAQLAARGDTELPSADPTAYCQARQRLPGEIFAGLLTQTSDQMKALPKTEHTWLGRRVWITDGSTVSMSDTPELQAAFPQPAGQEPGCGFPVAKFVALFCWATGAIVDIVISSLAPHELPLFRKLWHHFTSGDVVLNDRAYCAYVDFARLRERGVFCVSRLHQKRKINLRAARRLGPDDWLTTWARPEQWIASCGASEEEFEHLPETLDVRIVRITHVPRGFRSRPIWVATTLLNPIETPADQIRMLYRDRWTAELNFRSLKTALGMDILHGKSVDVVSKEIVMHLVAYNLIRLLMWRAAAQHGRDLHRLSFTGTLHRWRATLPLLIQHRTLADTLRLIGLTLQWIADDLVPDRPDRLEPRRRKRRPKQYNVLQHPRGWYHQRYDSRHR
jgi:IS4 transposase